MALKIKNISGVICIKGKIVASQRQEIRNYFNALLTVEDAVMINLCEVKKGNVELTNWLDAIMDQLPKEKSLHYYGCPGKVVEKLYKEINNPANFYRTAA